MIISGTAIAHEMYIDFQRRVEELQKKNVTPHLVAILVGENPASIAYVNLKQKRAEAIGAVVTVLRYEESVTEKELLEKIKQLNTDPDVHGILIQRPLPEHIDVAKLEETTDPEKDIDGFHKDSPYTLPLSLAVVEILKDIFSSLRNHEVAKQSQTNDFNNWLQTKQIVVLGKGPTGGGPIIAHLKKLELKPTLIDSNTPHPEDITRDADIIISATGKEHMITADKVKQDVILIGVGVMKGTDGKLHGDYEPEEVDSIASFYTPTPGGVGPVNVAKLIDNLITAAEKQTK